MVDVLVLAATVAATTFTTPTTGRTVDIVSLKENVKKKNKNKHNGNNYREKNTLATISCVSLNCFVKKKNRKMGREIHSAGIV